MLFKDSREYFFKNSAEFLALESESKRHYAPRFLGEILQSNPIKNNSWNISTGLIKSTLVMACNKSTFK